MRITDIEVAESPQGAELSATLVWERGGRETDDVRFVYRGVEAGAITAPGDALAAAMVVVCMGVGEDLYVDAPVSPKLRAGIAIIVDVFRSWGIRRYRTHLEAAPGAPAAVSAGGIGAAFSGGGDSFFTALRSREEPITTLLTAVGYDMRYEDRSMFESFLPRLSAAAERMGKALVVVDTTAYEVGRKYLRNADHHGAFLASIALGLSGRIKRFYIPASRPYSRMAPAGSHPFTDPLWSSDTVEVIHDGAEVCKVERLLAIARSDVVLDTLRVCSRHPDRYNCGRCEKCVLTALALHQAGTLDRCRTLPRPTASSIRRMLISPLWIERYEVLREQIDDAELKRALGFAITTARVLSPARPISKLLRRTGLRK